MNSQEALSALAESPKIPVPTNHGDISVKANGIDINGIHIPNVSHYELFSYLGLPKRLLKKDDPGLTATICNYQLKKFPEKTVNAIVNDGTVVSFREEGEPFLDSAQFLLKSNLTDEDSVELTSQGIVIRKSLPLEVEAGVGDPVAVSYTLKNNEFGPDMGLHLSTYLERLACSNGAIVKAEAFADSLQSSDLIETRVFETEFVQGLNTQAQFLHHALTNMTTATLGVEYEMYYKRHKNLLGLQPKDEYDADSTYWTLWNSVTESAKRSPRRQELQMLAGNLLTPFITIAMEGVV